MRARPKPTITCPSSTWMPLRALAVADLAWPVPPVFFFLAATVRFAQVSRALAAAAAPPSPISSATGAPRRDLVASPCMTVLLHFLPARRRNGEEPDASEIGRASCRER